MRQVGMQVTAKAEYALRAATVLASSGPGPVKSEAIAAAPGRFSRVWDGLWPKLTALGLFFLAWQAIVWSHWKPEYVLPGPVAVLKRMWHGIVDTHTAAGSHVLVHAAGNTLQRAVVGYGISVVIGVFQILSSATFCLR